MIGDGTLQSFFELHDFLRQDEPQFFHWAAPRRYVNPSGFLNPVPIYTAATYQNTLAMMAGAENNRTVKTGYVLSLKLAAFKMPVYFVEQALCEAVAATTIDPELALTEMRWPLPAMLFSLPAAFCLKAFGRRLGCISIGRLDVKEGFDAPPPIRLGYPKRFICDIPEPVFALYFDAEEPQPKLMAGFNMTVPLADTVGKTMKSDIAYDDTSDLGQELEIYHPVEDTECANRVFAFMVKLLMVMTARPQLIETGICLREARVKKGRAKDALWSPNFVGRGYRHNSEPVGTHASPRLHFRRGHLHTYLHGSGKTLRKLLWVEPVLVGH